MTNKTGWLLSVCLVFVLGCGGDDSNRPKTYPVTGTVKLNGNPVDGAMITFNLTEGKGNAIGSTDAKGNYALTTFKPGDGAVPGQYKISVSKFEAEKAPANATTLPPGQIASGEIDLSTYAPPSASSGGAKAAAGPKNLLPAKFANADTSGLRAVVDDKTKNVFDFDLK
ncbi:MAG: carboxypeptidase-like regulatory domain-containing protein [Pirellula sp.]